MTVALSFFFLGVVAIESFLYAIRWYELSSRRYEPGSTWLRAIFSNRMRPLRTFARECFFSIVYIISFIVGALAGLFRGGRSSQDFSKKTMVETKPVIVLIHGYMAKPAMFWLMRLRLRLRRIPNVLTFGYRSSGKDFEDYRDRLRDFMLKVRAETGITGVVLVGHSLGGVIAFEYAAEYGKDGDVKGVAAMASPFRGSRLASFGITSLERFLHPQNPAFAKIIRTRINAPFISVYSKYDQLVEPYTNSEHPMADENIVTDSCGHAGFYFDGKVFKSILNFIKEIEASGSRN